MQTLLGLTILFYSVLISAAAKEIHFDEAESHSFGLNITKYEETPSNIELSLRLPSRNEDSCNITQVDVNVDSTKTGELLFQSYLADWKKEEGFYSVFIIAQKTDGVRTRLAARYKCSENGGMVVAYFFPMINDLIKFYKGNDLFVPKYVPISLLMDTNGEGKLVDENFIGMTKLWRTYQDKVDSTEFTNTKIYEDADLRQSINYLNGELLLVETFDKHRKSIINKQYYRKGFIYLKIGDMSHDGKFDLIQYYQSGKAKYLELLPELNSRHEWW